MGKFELQVLYARAMTRVWEKIERAEARCPGLSIADFGTRRRHGFLWQDWCVQAMIEGLGPAFLGTSNCLIALRREVEAIGTNAHELPMVYAALADNDAELAAGALQGARRLAGGLRRQPARHPARHLRHAATSCERAPDWVAHWTGMRIDSGDPIEGGEEAIDWWKRARPGPDGEAGRSSPTGSTSTTSSSIHRHFHGRVRIGYGWGTLLTNDFRGLAPDGAPRSRSRSSAR